MKKYIKNKKGFTQIVDFDEVISSRTKSASSKFTTGFTLIELLVVISIISLLSSIVFATLGGAKLKAKDAAAKQGVREFEKLMILQYDDYSTYAPLQQGAWITGTPCSSAFGGVYATQAISICNNIISNAKVGNDSLVVWNNTSAVNKYSIMVKLNNGKSFCVGSSGSSETSGGTGVGCMNNP